MRGVKGEQKMDIQFTWYGHPIDKSDKNDFEIDIKFELKDKFNNITSGPVAIYLTNDILKSVISGVVIDSNKKHIMNITRYPYEQNRTIFELAYNEK